MRIRCDPHEMVVSAPEARAGQLPGSDLGILGLEALHYYVRDLERARRFYVERLDFQEIGESGPALREGGRQRSIAFRAGECVVVCSTPEGPGGRAAR